MAKYDTTFLSKTPPFGDAQALPFIKTFENADRQLLEDETNLYLRTLGQSLTSDTLLYAISIDIQKTPPPMPTYFATLFMTVLGSP